MHVQGKVISNLLGEIENDPDRKLLLTRIVEHLSTAFDDPDRDRVSVSIVSTNTRNEITVDGYSVTSTGSLIMETKIMLPDGVSEVADKLISSKETMCSDVGDQLTLWTGENTPINIEKL